MDFSHYSDHSVQAAADLVNTKGSITGNEYLPDVAAAEAFLEDHGMADRPAVTTGDVKELRSVRDRLREVFFAEDATRAAALLNDYLDELDVKPYLTDHDGQLHLHYVPGNASVARRVAAATAMGLASVISTYGYERLGVCAADNCRDVFVDMSRNCSRRYCNEVCSSRTNVAAYRARHKAKR